MTRRCDITDLLVAECAHCRRLPDLEAEAPRELGPIFTSNYDGTCTGCKERTYAGDQIRADGSGFGYLGVACCGTPP